MFMLQASDRAEPNARRLERLWHQHVAQNGEKSSLSLVMWRFCRTRCIVAMVFMMLAVIFQFLGPVSLRIHQISFDVFQYSDVTYFFSCIRKSLIFFPLFMVCLLGINTAVHSPLCRRQVCAFMVGFSSGVYSFLEPVAAKLLFWSGLCDGITHRYVYNSKHCYCRISVYIYTHMSVHMHIDACLRLVDSLNW